MALDIAGITARAAAIGFEVAGNAKTTATLYLGKTNTYSWATDSTVTSAGQDVTTEGIFYSASQKQREITGNEAFFLIEGSDAPTVDESDSAEVAGKTWQIHDVQSVPGNAVFILGLRK